LLQHTFQCCLYSATDYRNLHGVEMIVSSMSAKNCGLGNAVMESFFSSLRVELKLDDNSRGWINRPLP